MFQMISYIIELIPIGATTVVYSAEVLLVAEVIIKLKTTLDTLISAADLLTDQKDLSYQPAKQQIHHSTMDLKLILIALVVIVSIAQVESSPSKVAEARAKAEQSRLAAEAAELEHQRHVQFMEVHEMSPEQKAHWEHDHPDLVSVLHEWEVEHGLRH
ncbi:unnamed protein product [Orchesella dallaii]|uniref:Uncharacterized protein n=1 Tax=Orchesella dallaii TaxID=48710 RepID=A0ABP1RV60_9HEXA